METNSISRPVILGVPPFIRLNNGGDCNTLATTKGIYFHYLTGDVSNSPIGTGTSYLMVMTVCWALSDQWQLACDIVSAKMWYRNKGSVNWGVWKLFATV